MSDLTTEVIGYRQWYVTPELELRAAHKTTQRWKPGQNTAVCHKNHDDLSFFSSFADPGTPPPEPKRCETAPGHDCECGFYALHAPSDLWYGRDRGDRSLLLSAPSPSDPLVSGVIVAWGEIEVHHSGFRAQHARIAALAVPENKRDATVARAIASAYGVPCVPVEQLPEVASEFGVAVPEEMRPPKPPKRDELYWFNNYQRMLGTAYQSPSNLYLQPPAPPAKRRKGLFW